MLFDKNFSRKLQSVFLILMLVIPGGMYFYGKSKLWPAQDISEHIQWHRWAKDSPYLASKIYRDDAQHQILRYPDFTPKPIPEPNTMAHVLWLDDRFLIRKNVHFIPIPEEKRKTMISPWLIPGIMLEWEPPTKEGIPGLRVYDFIKQEEYILPTNEEFILSTWQPINPGGNLLAWLNEYPQKEANSQDPANQSTRNIYSLCMYDLSKGYMVHPNINLPEDIQWISHRSIWIDNHRLVIYGSGYRPDDDEMPFSFYTWMFDTETQKGQLKASLLKFTWWHATRIYPYAFARNEDQWFCVNLENNEMTPIASGSMQYQTFPKMNCAYRIATINKRAYITQFSFETQIETQLCPLPEHCDKFICFSNTGKYALFSVNYYTEMMPIYLILHISTGNKHYIYTPGIATFPTNPSVFVEIEPSSSPFSPDDKYMILTTADFADEEHDIFYTIPSDWPN